MRHVSGLVLAALLASGCFVEALGASDGAGPGGGGGTAATTTGATAATATNGSATTTSTTGSSTGGGGGTGGGAGGPPCATHLSFDGGDEGLIAHHASIDIPDDFAFGARVRLDQDPKFSSIDAVEAGSQILRRVDAGKGYSLAVVELGFDGLPHASVGIYVNSSLCLLTDPSPIDWNTWTSIAVKYLRTPLGQPDIELRVEGHQTLFIDCGDNDVSTFTYPLEVGFTATIPNRHLLGDVDDLYVKYGTIPAAFPATPACTPGISGLFTFEPPFGLGTACPMGRALSIAAGAAPAAPSMVCE